MPSGITVSANEPWNYDLEETADHTCPQSGCQQATSRDRECGQAAKTLDRLGGGQAHSAKCGHNTESNQKSGRPMSLIHSKDGSVSRPVEVPRGPPRQWRQAEERHLAGSSLASVLVCRDILFKILKGQIDVSDMTLSVGNPCPADM